jgi:hypothetical protein
METCVVDDVPQRNASVREQHLLLQHGEVCDVAEAARILKYPSVHALRRALSRSKAPIRLIKLPYRRGLFASTRAIARYLDAHLDDGEAPPTAHRRSK